MKRTGIARSTKPLARRVGLKAGKPPTRRTPLRSKPSRRARPDEPLATWCQARLPGYCTGRATDRHHLLPSGQGGGDEASNTVDICRRDHRYIHANPTWAYGAGWLRKREAAA